MTEPAPAGLPLWTVLPFVAYLAALALVPLALPRFWESNRNKLAMAAAFSVPVAVGLWRAGLAAWLAHSAGEYVSFIALLGSLFVITGGVYVRGSLAGTPLVNTALLAIGARARQLDRHHRRLDAADPAAAAGQRERGGARPTSSSSSSSSSRTAAAC